MASPAPVNDDINRDMDKNRDGVIDSRDMPGEQPIPDYHPYPDKSIRLPYISDDYDPKYPCADPYPSHGVPLISSDMAREPVIRTRNPEETQAYIDRTPNICKDPNPQIIRRAMNYPVRHEQRIFLRCLQPPVQEPPPIIIKQVRPPQPPPLPPLIIREEGTVGNKQATIVLRERPPPPPQLQPERKICYLPPLPPPPRPVIIERMPNLPNRPADIIIERWLPYRFAGERRKIVEPAPPATSKYPSPCMQIICYQGSRACITRRFQHLGVIPANPADYVARYGSSLLDRVSLEQRARELGVVEDISCNGRVSTTYPTVVGGSYDCDTYGPVVTRPYAPPTTDDCVEILRRPYSPGYNSGSAYYPSSYKYLDRSASRGEFPGNYSSEYV